MLTFQSWLYRIACVIECAVTAKRVRGFVKLKWAMRQLGIEGKRTLVELGHMQSKTAAMAKLE